MAFKLDQNEDPPEELHEINVTPFIDVILVLLIIFMVAAPLSTVDVAVDLPAASATPPQRPDKPVFLTIKADRTLAVGEEPIIRSGLASALSAATGSDKSQRIHVRADKSVSYGEVMEVMEELRSAGFLKVALVAIEKSGAR